MFIDERITLPKGTKIKIEKSIDVDYIGLIGEIRHSFPKHIWAKQKYILSMKPDKRPFEIVNLLKGDKYTTVFTEYNDERQYYYIEGSRFVLQHIPLKSYEKVLEKFEAHYRSDAGQYVFSSEEFCNNCISHFEKLCEGL